MYADFQPFELLFESAMEAFTDTYFRESVSSFAAALERFYEFSIATLVLKSGVPSEVLTKMWNSVSNQSERQLGMYIGLYTANFGRQPELLSDTDVKFRNKVIHKGNLPSPEQALAFGKEAYVIITKGIKELRSQCGTFMEEARQIARSAAAKQIKPDEVPTMFGMGTTISLLVVDEPPKLEEALGKVAARMKRQRAESAAILSANNSAPKE